MGADCGCGGHETRGVDNSAWDGGAAMSHCAASSTPGSCYSSICAGRKSGDAALQSSWALPHHKQPGSPPNAAGVRNALSRLSQTGGLTNAAEARHHLEAHMASINAQSAKNSAAGDLREAAHRRAQAHAGGRRLAGPAAPAGAARSVAFPATEMRAQLVDRDGRQFYRVEGYASIVERGYEMWDMFGPYEEIVDARAFDETLAASPDVAFLVNHRGLMMARTTNGSLELSIDSTGLRSVGYLNPNRQDVRDLASAIDDRLVTEMSFAFMLDAGEFNQDFTQFRITKVDINRGDVSAVNYGANPYTSIAARSREILSDLDHLPPGAARAALGRLQQRLSDDDWALHDHRDEPATGATVAPDVAVKPTEARGRKIELIEALLEVD